MELKIFRDTLPQAGTSCTVKAELPLETEILISDYLPPVFKLVKCFAKPVVLQKQLQPGRLTLEGYLRCTVFYQGEDGAGEIDVAAIEIERAALPPSTLHAAFTPAHLAGRRDRVEVGSSLLIVGFPLGFHDQLHHMPVARQAVVASSFGLRFQGQGYFLTDARTHRGTSGAPVVMRLPDGDGGRGELPWLLLGVHSARLDAGGRDAEVDEALGLNCAWYADILMTLSALRPTRLGT